MRFLCVFTVMVGCASEPEQWVPPDHLSAFGLFKGKGATQEPAEGVVPYNINTPLFTDYTEKYRFIKFPDGKAGMYDPDETFDLPVGTIIVKTFAYPHDMRNLAKGRRLLETRLLVHRPDGWVGLPYVWNEEQTDAVLEIAGEIIKAQWVHTDGQKRKNLHLVPNMNQCKQCHNQNDKIKPIGIRARHLNRDYDYLHGTKNQLAFWSRMGMVKGVPDPADAPRLAVWNDPNTGTVETRARAWVEINCAHCHSPAGRGWSTGLDLMASQTDSSLLGVYKLPTAAGRATGGFEYDIVPGKPDESIFVYRIASTEADIVMPELGRRLVHEEGLALVREWIENM